MSYPRQTTTSMDARAAGFSRAPGARRAVSCLCWLALTLLVSISVHAQMPPRVAVETASGELARVPRLVGQRPDVAHQLAELAGVRLSQGMFYIAPHKWRNHIVPGSVALQTPQPEGELPVGAWMFAWSLRKAREGQEVVTMPDLREGSVAEARRALEPLGLPILGAAPAEDDGTAPVLDQYPRPGQRIYKGSSVCLITDADLAAATPESAADVELPTTE